MTAALIPVGIQIEVCTGGDPAVHDGAAMEMASSAWAVHAPCAPSCSSRLTAPLRAGPAVVC